MSTVRCPNCRTVAEAGYRFCYVCGLEYARAQAPMAQRPPAELQARGDGRSTSVVLTIFGSIGAIGALQAVLVMPIPPVQKGVLFLLLAGFAVFGFVAAFRRGGEQAALGRWVLRGFAAVAWMMLVGLVLLAGLCIYLFVLCATHVGKY